jgi:hypothetical protein
MDDGSEPDQSDGGSLPVEGYDRLKPRELKKSFSSHSQDELENIERYERANKKRPAILDKLRFMRGRQPLPGYDQLTPEVIGQELGRADMPTIKRIRDYERKFQNRPEVLEEVARLQREQRTGSARA